MMHEIDVPCDYEQPLPLLHPQDPRGSPRGSHDDPRGSHDEPPLNSRPQGVILIDVFAPDDDDDDVDHVLEKTEENLKDGGELSKGGGGGAVSGVDDPELTGESSELLTAHRVEEDPPLEVAPGRSKWVKLRSTIKVACAFTPSVRKRQQLERQDSFLKRFSTRQAGSSQYSEESNDAKEGLEESRSKEREMKPAMNFVINPDETFMFLWLTGLTCAVLYNLWTCIAREAFPEIHEGFEPLWFTADALCDLVYLLDVVVQLRTGYLEHGLIVYDSLKLTKHYVYSRDFVLDAVSLIPLDLVQIYIGVHPLIRFPRFLKAYRLYRFVYMVETRTAFPNMWRVANLSHVLFLGCHWFAAFYFLISKAEQFSTSWSYPPPNGEYASVTQKYLRSLYWSTLTLTTIGDLQSPESNWEFAFTITSYLIGVFVFATIVGQVGNVITNQNASRQEFERHLDGAKAYMRYHNVPRAMQQRVQRWYDYAWSRGRMNGGGDINSLGLLPDKLKTELALHVNLETLKKVAIFQKCEPEFLHDLVLKMKAFIFTPRDLICRKGEVAREMFIIADGLVEVVGDSGEVLKQMGAGDFFGEIGILNLDGGVNRRTADVRSLGYSELFVLSRDDVLSAFKDHPEAKELIMEYGEKRLKELGEHKRRMLCERLAKEISSTAVVDGGRPGTVGRMVLSTGLLHGIGVAASAAASSSSLAPGVVVVKKPAKTLSNGGSLAGLGPGNDRWTNVVKMAMSKDKDEKDGDSVASSQTQNNNNNKRCGHERVLFRGLRSRDRGASRDAVPDSKGTAGGTSATELPATNSSVVGQSPPKQNDVTVPRRLAGFFASKRRGAPPRPAKLWSLGLAGRGQPVSRLVSTETSHQNAKNGLKVEGASLLPPASPSSNNETSTAVIKTPNSAADNRTTDGGSEAAALPRRRMRNLLEVIRSKHPSDGVDNKRADCGGVPLSPSSDDKSQHESNKPEQTVAKSDGLSQPEQEIKRHSLLELPASPSSTILQSTASLLSLASSVESSAVEDLTKDWPDSRTVSAQVTEKVHALIHSELVAMQSQYQGRLRQLEEEIVQKQRIIDRLRSDLDAFNRTE